MVTKEHSLEPATLIPLAIKAQEHQSDIFCEAAARLMQIMDTFAHPKQFRLCPSACFLITRDGLIASFAMPDRDSLLDQAFMRF